MIKLGVKVLVLGLAALMSLNAWAASVDAVAAGATAKRFIQSSRAGRPAANRVADMRLVQARPSSVDARLNDYYVFNATDGSTFVIVAGDDRAMPVLAYGDGAIDMDDIPCNMQWMLDHYKEQMDWLLAHPEAEVRLPAPKAVVIAPLLPCNWYQTEPYNWLCPVNKGKHCVTGCVATAMAQVMYYWKYPDNLPDLIGYTTYSLGIVMPDIPPVTLDWDNMLDSYAMSYTQEQGDAVATLMRYCGQASYMDYTPTGSGAICDDQVVAMRMFGYNPATLLLHRERYSYEEWDAMMLADLEAHCPILYAGNTPESGHAFVIDGYKNNRYHINWGWAGSSNGYFAIDAFMDFTSNQVMINQLYPFEFGVDIAPYDFEVDGIYYKKCDEGSVKVANRDELFNSYSGTVNIPSQVTSGGVTYQVTAIGNGAFRNSKTLKKVTIPSTVTKIGKYAFMDCMSLTSVNIPSSVKVIDYAAFENCMGLTSINLPEGLEEIGYYAFAVCGRLSGVKIPNSVTSLGDGAFYGCYSLKSLDIGDGVEKVSYTAFAFCENLTTAAIGNGAKLIDAAAFYDCTRLEQITVGEGVDSIGDLAFDGCLALSRLIMHPELPPLTASEDCFDGAIYDKATVYVADEWIMEDYRWADVWILFSNFDLMENLPGGGMPGDVNGDGEISIADINALIDAILTGEESSSFDVNGDGEVNIADINAVIDLILAAD